MHPQEFREMQALEESHWWYRGKRLLLETMLDRAAPRAPARMLDIGCGTGGVLRGLARQGFTVGVDRAEVALRFCREKGFTAVVLGSAFELPFARASFDVCTMMDVLEHVDDEQALLAEARRVLRPGGALLVSVPAFAALWSQHDETLEHRRRYRKPELTAVVAKAGLRIEWSSYTNFFVFPPTLAWRLLRRFAGLAPGMRTDLFPTPAPLNAALVGTYRAEAALLRRLPLPFGVSVACVARNA